MNLHLVLPRRLKKNSKGFDSLILHTMGRLGVRIEAQSIAMEAVQCVDQRLGQIIDGIRLEVEVFVMVTELVPIS